MIVRANTWSWQFVDDVQQSKIGQFPGAKTGGSEDARVVNRELHRIAH